MADNSTALAYIRNQGGTRSLALFRETQDLFGWLNENDVSLQTTFIPGRRNALADPLSRKGQACPAEWTLHPDVCKSLWRVWDTPTIDAFATRWTNRLNFFISPVPDKKP